MVWILNSDDGMAPHPFGGNEGKVGILIRECSYFPLKERRPENIGE